jgi:hypothetical protein
MTMSGIAEAPVLVLTAQDRCDQGECGAAAQSKVTFEGGLDLLFCKHHLTKNREKLEVGGAVIEEMPVPA